MNNFDQDISFNIRHHRMGHGEFPVTELEEAGIKSEFLYDDIGDVTVQWWKLTFKGHPSVKHLRTAYEIGMLVHSIVKR